MVDGINGQEITRTMTCKVAGEEREVAETADGSYYIETSNGTYQKITLSKNTGILEFGKNQFTIQANNTPPSTDDSLQINTRQSANKKNVEYIAELKRLSEQYEPQKTPPQNNITAKTAESKRLSEQYEPQKTLPQDNITVKIPEPIKRLKRHENRQSEDIAQSLKNDIYAKTSLGMPTTGKDIAKHIAEINADNVDEVMKAYEKINGDGENLMEAILKERGLSTEKRTAYLLHIKSALIASEKQNGVYADDISEDFDKEIKHQMEKFGVADADYINSFLKKLNDRIAENNSSKIDTPNGEIDQTFSQGKTEDCWLLASIQALAQSPKGLEILNDSVSVDKAGNVTVTLKGVNKSYVITPEELAGNKQLSSGDGDVRAIEIAMDRYFQEERGVNDRIDLNGNKEYVAYRLLTGKGGKNWFSRTYGRIPEQIFGISDSQIDNFNTPNHIACVAAGHKKNLTFAAFDGTGNITLHSNHAYAVKGSDKDNVYLVNPHDTSEVITVPRETFKDFFNAIDEFDLE